MDNSGNHGLDIVLVNINSIRARLEETKCYINSHFSESPPLLTFCDTRLHESLEDPHLNNYSFYREDHISDSSRPGGVAVAIPPGWKAVRNSDFLQFKTASVDLLCLTVFPPQSDPMKILVIYNHPGEKIKAEVFIKFKSVKFNNKSIKGFVLSDFNSPNTCFGSRTTSPPG
jgi:exonuclease III